MAKISLKQQAYDYIKEKIIKCEYLPNTILNEEQLRTEIGGSRTPIRDALGRLEQENLVRILPKKGVIVSPVSITEINDIDEARMMIEPYAIRTHGHKISKERYQEFWNMLQKDPKMVQDYNEMYDFDQIMHQEIVEATGNKYIINMYNRIYSQVLRLRILSGEVRFSRLEETKEEHSHIIKACIMEDWEAAAKAMEEHLYQSKKSSLDAVLSGSGFGI